jgi:hypothetical protein
MRSNRFAIAVTGVVAAALATVLGPATPASANTECGERTTTQAFAQFGDTNEYFPLTGGTFESGNLSPFTVTGGPRIVDGNEPWRVLGSGHSRSLALPPKASIKASFCVQVREDSMRAFLKPPGGAGAVLKVGITVRGGTYSSGILRWNRATTAAWAPTERYGIDPGTAPDGRRDVTITFTNEGSGTWLLDDILVDPWKTK